jgi:hypothetical protein
MADAIRQALGPTAAPRQPVDAPSPIIASIAGTPSAVAGILTNRFGLLIRSCNARAAAMMAAVSRASSGATSIDTKPSVPPLASNVPRQHTERLRDVVENKIPVRVQRRASDRGERRELFVVGIGTLDRPGEDRRVRGHTPYTAADKTRKCAIPQVGPGQIVQPRTLTLLVVESTQFGHYGPATSIMRPSKGHLLGLGHTANECKVISREVVPVPP